MIVAATAGLVSNLELVVPLVVIVVVMVAFWDNLVESLNRALEEQDERPLTLVNRPRTRGVVERRPEDRERARRERAEARRPRHRTRGLRR